MKVYKIVNGLIGSEVWKFGSLQNCKLTDKSGSLDVYKIVNGPIGLEVWKFGRLHIVCDGDTSKGLEVYKSTGLHVVCDDDKSGSLGVYKLCVMMISLEVWRCTNCV